MSEGGVPPENILDLRRTEPLVAEKREPLRPESFLRKPPERRPRPKKPRVALRERTSLLTMRARALVLHYRLRSFPVIAGFLLVTFAGVVIFAEVVGVRANVTSIASVGYASLKIAGAKAASRDLIGAVEAFQDAEENFRRAEESFDELNSFLATVLSRSPYVGSRLRSGQHLLRAARFMSSAGSRFSTLALPLAEPAEGFIGAATFVSKVERDRASLDAMVSDLGQAVDELGRVNPRHLPSPYRAFVSKFQAVLPELRTTIHSVADGVGVLADILGVDRPREYLFVFQNSNELRASGGFLGSFALIRLDDGTFRIFDAPHRGSLGVDDYLPETITPPRPLQVITPSWYFRDANWYPDFPTTAQQLVRFYEQARGFRPDGVIAVTNGFLEELLEITGPIELTAYGLTLTRENIIEVIQEQVEQRYDLRVNDPKRIIVDLVPVLADRLSILDLGQYPALLAAVSKSVANGDLQLWSATPETQGKLTALGWSGSMPESHGDFLALIDSNIGGGKSDSVIREVIHDDLTIADGGTLTAAVTVTRTHDGTAGDPFTGARNRTYHRLYVPRGSKLVSATGFTEFPPNVFRSLPDGSQPDPFFSGIEGRVTIDEESGTRINEEFGKTVFGNWTELDPGESVTFNVTYELPFKLVGNLERYDLTLWRQPGAKNRVYDVKAVAQGSSKIVWTSDGAVQSRGRELEYSVRSELENRLSFVVKR